MNPTDERKSDGEAAPGSAPNAAPASGLGKMVLAGTRNLALDLPRRIFEIDFDLSDSREELRKKIAWIIRIRFVVSPAVFLLMLVTNWQGLTRGAGALSQETLLSTGLVTVASLALNILYFFALRRQQFELRKFVSLQLLLDVLTFSAYLWRTGGPTSPFSFLFFLPIIAGSMLLSPGTGMAFAGVSGLCYSALAALELAGWLPHVSYFVALDQFARRGSYVTLMILVNLFAFAVVAGAAGFLMRTLHRKTRQLAESNRLLERKAHLLGMLYQVSELLQRYRSRDEILDGICDILITGMNVDRALMYIREGGELRLLRVAYHTRVPEPARQEIRVSIPLEPSGGLTARAALENRAFNVTEPTTRTDINRDLERRIGQNPFAVAPLDHRGRVLGVLGIDRATALGRIGEDEFDVLKLFARQAAQTLAGADVDSVPRPS